MTKAFLSVSALLLFYCVLFCTSCKSSSSSEEFTETETGIVKFETNDTVNSSDNLQLNLTLSGYDGCCQYSRYSSNENADTLEFKFYIKVKNQSVCTQALIEIPVNLEIDTKAQKKGYLYLKYKDLDNNYLKDSVFIE